MLPPNSYFAAFLLQTDRQTADFCLQETVCVSAERAFEVFEKSIFYFFN